MYYENLKFQIFDVAFLVLLSVLINNVLGQYRRL